MVISDQILMQVINNPCCKLMRARFVCFLACKCIVLRNLRNAIGFGKVKFYLSCRNSGSEQYELLYFSCFNVIFDHNVINYPYLYAVEKKKKNS